MYKLFLTLRYLRKRRIAYFAVAAVMLCVAMVIIVMSVMGGFHDKVKTRARGLLGDIIVDNRAFGGFPLYQEFLDDVRQWPEVAAATLETIAGRRVGLRSRSGSIATRVGPRRAAAAGAPLRRPAAASRFGACTCTTRTPVRSTWAPPRWPSGCSTASTGATSASSTSCGPSPPPRGPRP